MTCRNIERLLSAYIDQELSRVEMKEVRAHLEKCANCSAEVRMLEQMKVRLSAARMIEPPAATYGRIKAAIHSPEYVRVRRQRAFGVMAMTACLGALMTAVVLAKVETDRGGEMVGAPARDSMVGRQDSLVTKPASAQSPMIMVELSH